MAAMVKTSNEPRTVPSAGQHLKVISGYGTIPAADTTATLNVDGQISRIVNVKCTGINTFEVVGPTTAQPASGVVTFARSAGGADLNFWYEITGY
jgi:hypothetical protein